MKPAVGSIRVSTDKQDAAAQEARIRQWCTLNDRELVALYGKLREGESGVLPIEKRETEKAIEDACQRKCVLVLDSLDRLSRLVPDLYATAHRVLKSGANLICLAEGLDLQVAFSTAFGKAFFGFRAVFAQLERDIISERTTKALTNNKRNGNSAGPAPNGHQRDMSRPEVSRKTKKTYYPHLIPETTEKATLERIHAGKAAGKTYWQITQELNADHIPARNGKPWNPQVVKQLMDRMV